MTDSPYKERNSSPSARKAVPSSLSFPYISKAKVEKANKKGEAPFPLAWCKAGDGVFVRGLLTFAVVAHPPEAVPAFALV